MPELPEVETFICELRKNVLHKTIKKIEVTMPKILKNCDFINFQKILINQQFKNLTRIGKYLIFHLTNQYVVLLHLRMEGKPFWQHQNDPYDLKHVLVRICFDDNHELRYHDTRRFGTIHLFPEKDYKNSKEIKKIGLDPTEKKFDIQYVQSVLQKSPNKAIKTVLLDQTKISGIGNIYADEILFHAKIHPETLVKNLHNSDFQKIWIASQTIIKDAIKHHGTTILSFKYKHGEIGSYQNRLKVHTLKGLPCKECQTKITKSKVNGRGTYTCLKCQIKK